MFKRIFSKWNPPTHQKEKKKKKKERKRMGAAVYRLKFPL